MKPEPVLRSKEIQTDPDQKLLTELAELRTMYEYLEDQSKIKDMTIERLNKLSNLLSYPTASNQTKERSNLELKISNLKVEVQEQIQKVKEWEVVMKRKDRIMNGLSQNVIDMKQQVQKKVADAERLEFEKKYYLEKHQEKVSKLQHTIRELEDELMNKKILLRKTRAKVRDMENQSDDPSILGMMF